MVVMQRFQLNKKMAISSVRVNQEEFYRLMKILYSGGIFKGDLSKIRSIWRKSAPNPEMYLVITQVYGLRLIQEPEKPSISFQEWCRNQGIGEKTINYIEERLKNARQSKKPRRNR